MKWGSAGKGVAPDLHCACAPIHGAGAMLLRRIKWSNLDCTGNQVDTETWPVSDPFCPPDQAYQFSCNKEHDYLPLEPCVDDPKGILDNDG